MNQIEKYIDIFELAFQLTRAKYLDVFKLRTNTLAV